MKKAFRGVFAFLALASAVSLSAQTADEIVSKYLAAIGGKETIAKVKSISSDGSTSIMGNDAPTTSVILDGVGYKSEVEFNGVKIVQSVSDKGGWAINPMAGSPDAAPLPEEDFNRAKSQLSVGGPLYDYAAKGGKIELVSKDAKSFNLKLTTKEGVESVFVIDATTYLLTSVTTKGKMMGQDVDVISTFSDYRKTDVGMLVPYAVDVNLGGQFSMTITIKKVELNKTIDPAIFAMPAAPKPAPAAAPAS